jgi:hypothetical protein
MFFFEKKNQKTFTPAPSRRSDTLARCVPEQAKVFWFFFSKKNIFLPTYGTTLNTVPHPSAVHCGQFPPPSFVLP